MLILTENDSGKVMEVILAGVLLPTTNPAAVDASGVCGVYLLGEELHDKNEHGSQSDAHVNHPNHACHRALLSLDCVEF